jgi:hypothetical protein
MVVRERSSGKSLADRAQLDDPMKNAKKRDLLHRRFTIRRVACGDLQKGDDMRVPDLDWPTDLFSDVIEEPAENVVMAATARPGLWADMVRAWIGNDTPWAVEAFNSTQLAW